MNQMIQHVIGPPSHAIPVTATVDLLSYTVDEGDMPAGYEYGIAKKNIINMLT